jgi:hypothetical protein
VDFVHKLRLGLRSRAIQFDWPTKPEAKLFFRRIILMIFFWAHRGCKLNTRTAHAENSSLRTPLLTGVTMELRKISAKTFQKSPERGTEALGSEILSPPPQCPAQTSVAIWKCAQIESRGVSYITSVN